MSKHQTCLVCASNTLQPLKNYYEKHGLVKCKKCGFVFMEAIPTSQELNTYYSNYDYNSEGYLSPLTIESYNKLLDEFEPFRKTNKILDVGCGRGWFLVEAQKRGWQVYGTEFSEEAIKQCRAKSLNMLEGELDASKFDFNDFDVITSFEVIEHINYPNRELNSIHQLLRKGGLFYCTTPNFNSLLRYHLKTDYNVITYPEHLSYYTKSTLTKLLKKHGFKPFKFLSTGISITRLKLSKKTANEQIVSKKSSDEILRTKLSKNNITKSIKALANNMLTWTNSGMTLKGYYIKK